MHKSINYQSPLIESIETKVENGFALSGDVYGDYGMAGADPGTPYDFGEF